MVTILVVGDIAVGKVEELILSHGHDIVRHPITQPEESQMRGTPFAAAAAMAMAISQAMSLPAHMQQVAMAGIGQYKSRGKGRGGQPRNHLKGAFNNRYPVPHQGRAEVMRRRVKIADGKLAYSRG